MSVDYLPQPNDIYKEDISTLAAGTSIVGQPCQVWQITVIGDIAQVGIIQFSDDATTYTAADRKLKIYTSTGQFVQNITFPHGLNCKKGLCATSNVAGVDVFVSYD